MRKLTAVGLASDKREQRHQQPARRFRDDRLIHLLIVLLSLLPYSPFFVAVFARKLQAYSVALRYLHADANWRASGFLKRRHN